MKTELIVKALSGNATDDEKGQVDKWLQDSEQNREQYKKTAILWSKLDGIYDDAEFDVPSAIKDVSTRIMQRNQKTKNRYIRYKYAVVATILLLIGFGFITYRAISHSNQSEQVYFSANSKKEIILADGSHVWLNSNSSITLPQNFSQKQRKVYLKGEAYFEIERDEANPFRVYAGKTVTEVLGTSFNIKLDTLSGNVNIIVSSGKIAFYNSENKREKAILIPDNLAIFEMQDQSIKVYPKADPNLLSWKTGILSFYNTPIDQVCDELSKHFNKKVFSSIKAKGLKLTGTFHDDSLEEILATIELTLDVRVSKLNNEFCIE
jgi:transmembrane sensor